MPNLTQSTLPFAILKDPQEIEAARQRDRAKRAAQQEAFSEKTAA
jgi:hypothetical protein